MKGSLTTLKYLFVSINAFRNLSVYKINMMIEIFFTIIQTTMLYYLWQAVYSQNEIIGGYSFEEMVRYVLIGQLLATVYFFFVEDFISSKFKDGSVSHYLMKPISFPKYVFFDRLGETAYRTYISILPLAILMILIFKIDLNVGLTTWFYFFISVVISWLTFFCIQFLIGLLVVFTLNSTGIFRFRNFLVLALSGAWVPLDMYPPFIREILMNLPLRSLYYLPLSIVNNKYSESSSILSEIVEGLGFSLLNSFLIEMLVWLAILMLLCSFFWNKAKNYITIQGG